MGKITVSSLSLLALLGTSVLAQRASTPETLLIGPGDMVQVHVVDTPELDQQVRVTDTGTVPLAYLGDVKVAGLTPSAAGLTVQELLVRKSVMHHPQVTVRVEEYATQDVAIMGQVHTPGSYPITTSQSVLKVLSLAGGLTDLADRHLTIQRHDSDQKVAYYASNNASEAMDQNVLVNPGDTVVVPTVALVYVMGDVGKPGGYPISTNDSRLSVLQVISMAGSVNKTAVPSHVRLIRTVDGAQTDTPVRLDQIEKGKIADLQLRPNDVLYVPFSWMRNVAISSSSIVAGTASSAVYVMH